MSALSKRHQNTVLFTSPHHLQPEVLSVEIIVLEDCLGVVCHDRHLRKSWRQRVSLCLVSSLVQRYYYSLRTLWGLIARSIVNTGMEISFSTQHIVSFRTTRTSERRDAHIILEVDYSCFSCLQLLSSLNFDHSVVVCVLKRPQKRATMNSGALNFFQSVSTRSH